MAGRRMPINRAMIDTTTSSSMIVKALSGVLLM
jgi:hypothetical protein